MRIQICSLLFLVLAVSACPAPAVGEGEGEGEGAAAGEGEGAAGEGEGAAAGEGEGAAAGEGEGAAAGEGEGAAGEGEGEGESLSLGHCSVFPAYDGSLDESYWNADISDVTAFPVDAHSSDYIHSMGGDTGTHVHPDFGSDFGIPFIAVAGDQPRVDMHFDDPEESDPGPYPIPPDAPVESDTDSHVLVIDRDACVLYESGDSVHNADGSWNAFSGAVFNLTSTTLRPDDFTSADAAGLPVFAGLARFDEVAAGHIDHALRFTADVTQHAFVHPATHFASDETDPARPPMGLRMRLKASACPDLLDNAGAQSAVIVQALCTYGIILADNGSDFFITGAPDPRWDDDDLDFLKSIPGDDFEAIATGPLTTD
ncbi:MAG TPA: hypothetical protein VGO62_14950 [Myxococcota bacterium]